MQLAIAIFNVPILQLAFETKPKDKNKQTTIGFKND